MEFQIGIVYFFLVFAGVGLLVYFKISDMATNKNLKRAYPNEPWKWRPDWARGYSKQDVARTYIFLIVFGLIFLVLPAPAYSKALKMISEENMLGYFIFLFPFFGVLIILNGIAEYLRVSKYGKSRFIFSKPGSLGGTIKGQILIPMGFKSRTLATKLTCVHLYSTGTSSKNRSNTTDILWQNTSTVTVHLTGRHALANFKMQIPFEVAETNFSNKHSLYYWELTVESEEPGFDYKTVFKVPVFKTNVSDPALTQKKILIETAEKKIQNISDYFDVRTTGDKIVYSFKQQPPNIIGKIFTVIGLVVCLAFAWPLINGAEAKGFMDYFFMVFKGLGSLIGLVFALIGLALTFLKTEVAIKDKVLILTWKVFGFSWSKALKASDIKDYKIDITTRHNDKVWYSVKLDTGGKIHSSIPSNLPDKEAAHLLAMDIKQRLAS